MNLNLLFIIFFTHHVLCINTNTFEYECENYEKDEQALQSAYKSFLIILLLFHNHKNI